MEAVETVQQERVSAVTQWLSKRIIGQEVLLERLMTALLCGGHLLVEGAPGLAKTRLVETLGTVLGLEDKRVQCTPDLLPADIFGFSVLNPKDGSFTFRPGPIFCNILLVDEILSVGDAAFKQKAEKAMKERISGNQTVVFVSHSDAQVKSLCDRVIWIDQGKIRGEGEPDEVIAQYRASLKKK